VLERIATDPPAHLARNRSPPDPGLIAMAPPNGFYHLHVSMVVVGIR